MRSLWTAADCGPPLILWSDEVFEWRRVGEGCDFQRSHWFYIGGLQEFNADKWVNVRIARGGRRVRAAERS